MKHVLGPIFLKIHIFYVIGKMCTHSNYTVNAPCACDDGNVLSTGNIKHERVQYRKEESVRQG